ncbi:Scr1 family TA system antitoxin-like transcriptional regulator [Streptomyces sp. NPDC051554]|uniref:helix-turn-helix domain-containing protein n=1 Tax=Streptomyces sp. NPDC051554 TaxID=3365656 RepID=UPI0037AE7F27
MANGSRLAAWEFFGAELRRRREDMGLSQAQLGALVFVSGTCIGQFEQAIRKPQMDLAIRFDEILKTDGIFKRLCMGLINDRRYAEYFAKAAELEALATKICEFAHALIPGLLQTEEYIADKVDGRMERSSILKDATRPVYWAILHENVLRIPVGGPAAMARQLDHIAALVRARTVMVQILPYSAGAYSVMTGDLRLMEFDDAPPTAYTEAVYSGNLLDDPAVVKHAYAAYDLLRAAALSPEASLTLIESAAEDHRRCASTT